MTKVSDMDKYVHYPWRVGRSTGRTIWADTGEDYTEHVLLGMLDSPELARCLVEEHNRRLDEM